MTNTSQDPEPDDPRTQRVPRDARRPRRWACSARAVGWLRQACRERGAALRVADRRSIVIAMLGLTVALGPGGCGDEARPSTIPSNGGEAPANRAPTVVQGPSGASGAIREVLEGRASYYADSLAGNPTASTIVYKATQNPTCFISATPSKPFSHQSSPNGRHRPDTPLRSPRRGRAINRRTSEYVHRPSYFSSTACRLTTLSFWTTTPSRLQGNRPG